MKSLLESLRLIVARKDSRAVVVVAVVILFLLLLMYQNGKAGLEVLTFESLSFDKRAALALKVFFDTKSTFTPGTLLLAIGGIVLSAINLAIAYTYVRIRGGAIMKSGLYSGIGLLLAIFGVGCAACGTALLGIVLSFFGASAVLRFLPYEGQEIGYLGIIVLLIATYTLAQKLQAPNVC
jgi:hypothetical protein